MVHNNTSVFAHKWPRKYAMLKNILFVIRRQQDKTAKDNKAQQQRYLHLIWNFTLLPMWPEDDQSNPSGQLFSYKIQASVSQSESAATAYNHHHHLVHPRRKVEEEEQDTDCISTAFFVQTGFRIISTNQRPNYVCALESCVRNGLILASIDLLSDVMMVHQFGTPSRGQASV